MHRLISIGQELDRLGIILNFNSQFRQIFL